MHSKYGFYLKTLLCLLYFHMCLLVGPVQTVAAVLYFCQAREFPQLPSFSSDTHTCTHTHTHTKRKNYLRGGVHQKASLKQVCVENELNICCKKIKVP